MRIYVAGPYSKGDVALNVREAIWAGNLIAHRGHYPFIPHLTHFWHMQIPHEYEWWLEQDKARLEVCDAILRLPGESQGADKEVEHMLALGKPMYRNVFDIPYAKVTVVI